MRRALTAIAIALALLVPALPAGAQTKRLTADQVATALSGARHAYVQPGVSPRPDIKALSAVAAESPSFYLIVLARPVRGAPNAKASANRILEALKPQDPRATVGLVIGDRLAGASLAYPNDRIAKAVADSRAVAGTDPVGALTSFTTATSKPNMNGDDTAGGSGSSGGGWWRWAVLALLVVGIALVLLRIRARSNEQRRRRRGGSIWTAREFHLDRLEALAARHATLTGETTQAGIDPEAADHLQTAGARILALRRTLPQLTSPRELRTCAGELDSVEWEILWVEHRLADHAPPPPIARGFPGLCFFSHEHGLGTEAIELRRPDGTIATVYVSPENRLALERGDAPEVSMVHVGSRLIPWPAAPSWYGAYGWSADDLPGLEYDGQQIWGIDGPEREDPFAEDESPDAVEADAVPLADAASPAEAEAPVAAPDDAPAEEEPTRAWDGDDATVDVAAPPAAPVVPAAAPAAAPDSTFEELDEPAPAGLVDDPLDDGSEELFPPAAEPPDLPGDEDTLAGFPAPPPAGDATAEWDPFDDDAPRDPRP